VGITGVRDEKIGYKRVPRYDLQQRDATLNYNISPEQPPAAKQHNPLHGGVSGGTTTSKKQRDNLRKKLQECHWHWNENECTEESPAPMIQRSGGVTTAIDHTEVSPVKELYLYYRSGLLNPTARCDTTNRGRAQECQSRNNKRTESPVLPAIATNNTRSKLVSGDAPTE
jgi:hypothetical protein